MSPEFKGRHSDADSAHFVEDLNQHGLVPKVGSADYWLCDMEKLQKFSERVYYNIKS